MRVQDVISFSKEQYFNGAVQTEWFYDKARVASVALSYVFHGPKYYGVADGDVSNTTHKLTDTATFVKTIADKLYRTSSDNFVLTIAGYGTGKSHLAVCLGALFNRNGALRERITENIYSADQEIGEYIKNINKQNNLILVLNGMNNFNLDSELLRCTRLALEQDGLDDSILRSLTKSYDIARHFVERNFSIYQQDFDKAAKKHNIGFDGEKLKSYLLKNIETDPIAVSVINEVFTEVTGDSIHWERGISAGDVLALLSSSLCGEGKPYNKVLLLFDEFGRFIEYAAANPDIAGEAALQQIFEAIQNAQGNIVFTGFIQSDLSAYLSRIEKTANIVRYVGRYENSEKWYLSSNFETILANLIKKIDTKTFEKTVGGAIVRYQKFHSRIMNALIRWDRSSQKKSVWTNWSLYENVILKGCFPLHPITVWILANTSNWMQQRSTIAFASEMFDSICNATLEDTWLPYVYPIDIVDSNIYNEMLNSEEKGLVQSQNCMLFRDITTKVGNKLSENELRVLKAILVINICRFSFLDKEDAKTAIALCSNVRDTDLDNALRSLENMHGVIAFDETAKTFDLIAEASGFNEFSRIYTRYRLGVAASIEDLSEDLLKELNLIKPIETAFAKDHTISSVEWQFQQILLPSEKITEQYFQSRALQLKSSYDGESARGLLIYAYCHGDTREETNRLVSAYKASNLENAPIIVLLLDDIEGELIAALVTLKTLARFSRTDSERFAKHITAQQKACAKKIIQAFNRLANKRQMLSEKGVITYVERRNQLCSAKFESLYTKAPPFAFDGFEKKSSSQAKKYLSNICRKLFDKTMMNVQGYQALTQEEKNRVKACLSTGIRTSWQVFNNLCNLIEPQNALMKEVYDDLSARLSFDQSTPFYTLFGKYSEVPYGMNANALALFAMYFIAQKGNQVLCYYGNDKLSVSHLSDKIFRQDSLSLQEIKKISLRANPNAEIDVVAEKSKEALQCNSVKECKGLRKELESLIAQDGTTPANQLLVAEAKSHLEMGIKLYEKQVEELTRLRSLISEAKSEFRIQKFIRPAFQSSLSPDGLIDPEYPFTYEDDYKKQIAQCKKDIDALLRAKYLPALSRLSFAITQLSSAKSTFKKVSETLRQNGYVDLADATDKRIEEIETELLIKQKYEASLVDLEKDLAMCKNVSSYTFADTQVLLTKLQNWKSFLLSAQDLPQSMRKKLGDRIRAGEEQLGQQLKAIQEAIENIFASARNARSLQNLLETEKRLSSVESFEPPENMLSEAAKLIESIHRVQNAVTELPNQIDQLRNYRCPNQLGFSSVIRAECESKLNECIKKQAQWIKQFLIPIESEVGRISASSCSGWLSQTQTLPGYLDQQTVKRYHELRLQVEQRLHNCRVQGVVSMFNELTNEEKEECLKLLQKTT